MLKSLFLFSLWMSISLSRFWEVKEMSLGLMAWWRDGDDGLDLLESPTVTRFSIGSG